MINKFKYTLWTLALFCISNVSKAQEVVTADSVYENASELLLKTKIIQFDSNQTAEELKTKFKNWAALKFRNLNQVIVSETNEQIVLNYIDNYIYDAGFGIMIDKGNYYKMVAQFKTGKVRLTIYDDGNTFYAGGSGATPVAAHSSHYTDYFIYRTEVFNKGVHKANYRSITGYIDLNKKFIESIGEELKKPAESVLKDDW